MAHYSPTWYVLLAVVFAGLWAFIAWRNLRMKHRQEANAGHKGHIQNTPGSIAGAMDAEQRGDTH